MYRFVLKAALAHGYLSDPGELASFEMSLALHTALPKLEAVFQYYTDLHNTEDRCNGGSWVDWYGQTVCDPASLKKLVDLELIDDAHAEGSSSNRCACPLDIYFITHNTSEQVVTRKAFALSTPCRA